MASLQPDEIETKSLITIAIDFGTTFSGAAWHWSGNPGVREIITTWPAKDGTLNAITDEKVPTRLTYTSYARPDEWGIQVPESQKRYQEFKLLLGGAKPPPDTELTRKYTDSRGLALSPQFSAMKLTIDYLKCLKQHALFMIASKISDHTVQNTPIEWIISTPAIWTDSQKAATLFCAAEAGIKESVRLVAEPEAAINAAIDSMKAGELAAGQTFILCDCGGGTVDLITYVIDQLEPLKVRELVRGDGDRCGGVYVDRAFAEYMKEKYSEYDGWSPETLDLAVETFENMTKRRFDGTDGEVILRVAGLKNNPAKNIRKGKTTVPSEDIRKIFAPVLTIIKSLIKEQISAARQKQHQVTAILLVGGFGQSMYLKKAVEGAVDPNIKVWQVPDGRTAVVRGALLKGLNDADPENATMEVTSRIARRFYGISRGIAYRRGEHQNARKYWVNIEGKHFIQIAHWFIKKGVSVEQKKPEIYDYYEAWPANQKPPIFSIHVLAWDGPSADEPKPPRYDDSDLHLATLRVDLSRIPPRRRQYTFNGRLNTHCYECNIDIKVAYGSAGLEFSLWHSGKCYGRVNAEYE